MSTETKKFSVTSFLVLAVVAGLASVIAMRPSGNGQGPSADNYVLSVKFSPSFMVTPVDIRVTVDGVPLITIPDRHLSPWTQTMTAEKGALVVLTATSPNTDRLDCFISRNGSPVGAQGIDEIAFGIVTCST